MSRIEINNSLIQNLYEFYLNSLIGLGIDEYKKYDNFSVVYNSKIKDEYYNFITNIKCNTKNEFYEILDKGTEILRAHNRKCSVAVMPFSENVYNNRDSYLDRYNLISEEVWQVYDDFDNIESINSNCSCNVSLEKTEDMDLYAKELMNSYKTGEQDDPYGDLDSAYEDAYREFKIHNEGCKSEFFFIKVDDEIAGVTAGSYNDEFYGISSVAIKKAYRGKGIGRESMKQQLRIAKNMNVKLAFLETEEGFYPADFYRKIGFKNLCHCYYYTEK